LKFKSILLRTTILSGAAHGALVWTVYAITETLFSALLPWVINSNYIHTTPHWAYTPAHWGFTTLLFCIYPIIGLVLGSLSSLLLYGASIKVSIFQKTNPIICSKIMATFTLLTLYPLNLLLQPDLHDSSILSALFVNLVLAIFLILIIYSRAKFEKYRFIANPWSICFSLIGPIWIIHELLNSHHRVIKAFSIFIYLVLIFSISYLIHKNVKAADFYTSEEGKPLFLSRSFAVMALVIFIFIGISLFLKQKPLVVPDNTKKSSSRSDQPNVLLIVMDTVRADHLSVYGYERDTTPNLRNFAKNATLYTQAIAPSNMTLSTHGSIFTGLYARTHRAHFSIPNYPTGRPLDEKFQTLAEILSEKGYFSSAIIGNTIYLSLYHGLNQGFKYLDARNRVPFLGQAQPYYLKQVIRNILINIFPLSTFELKWRRAEEINEGAFDVLQRAKKNNMPFFLFINYMDAHWPYLPPSPFDNIFPGKAGRFTTERYNKIKDEVINLERNISDIESRHLVSQYDGGIAYIDSQIGKLIERLKELDLYENTLLIITSDHGEVFGERNIIEHSFALYQDEIHVPLIIHYPNNKEGHIIDDVVSLVDIMPTILELLGDETPEELQGNSLLNMRAGNLRTVISESFTGANEKKKYAHRFQPEWAIFSGSSKFIKSADGRREFYDLSSDPSETRNLFKTDHHESEKLEKELNEWLKTVKNESGSPVDYDRKNIERLKTLGYVE